VFNPTALVKDGRIHLLYRAEDNVGSALGTSRVGLALSDDGLHFDRQMVPIFYPANDDTLIFEWEGGCEDPRIVEDENGTWHLTYTAYDGNVARLLIATSTDLRTWVKHGSVFKSFNDGALIDMWSKSGSIITRQVGDQFIATKIDRKYWMYWGDTSVFLAWSADLINWVPVTDTEGGVGDHNLSAIFGPRLGFFDSDLVEPGPQAILRDEGILLIYNSRNKAAAAGGDPTLPEGTYSAAQILFDANDPSVVLQRADTYFMKPEKDYEIIGQVNNVVFLEGLVSFKGQWFVYYGTADSKIAVAVAEMN